MNSIFALVLGFAPGIFWLWFIYTRNRYHREPRSLVIRVFALGMVSTILVPIFELPLLFFTKIHLSVLENISEGSIKDLAVLAFLIVGPAEELSKFLIIRAIVFKSPYFSETSDGFIYSAAAALGFASIENVTYAIQFGWPIMFFRGPISTLVHVVIGGLWGYGLIRYKLKGRKALGLLLILLASSAVFHGLFDFLLFTQAKSGSRYWLLAYALFAGGLVIYWWMLQRSQKTSAQSNKVTAILRHCLHCNSYVNSNSRFCPQCGANLLSAAEIPTLICANCQNPIARDSRYCANCGYQLMK